MIQRPAAARNAIAEKINRVPSNIFDSHEQGRYLVLVATNDVDLMTQSL